MKKGYYIVPDIREQEKGIQKKIKYHIELFSQYTNTEKIVIPENVFIRKWIYRLPFGSAGGDYKYVFNKLKSPNFLYIRKGNMDRRLIKFLSKVRKKFPYCTILFEIPTYPYDKDSLGKLSNIFILLKDKYWRNKLYKYVDKIVVFSNDKEVFGCKTIQVENGINCSEVVPVKNTHTNKMHIKLIAVAQFRPQHGYERIIEGLANYYGEKPARKVSIIFVGEGKELSFYKSLVKKKHLAEYVDFVGSKFGEDLDRQYEKADIAVSALGMSKLGINYMSALKNREYMAKGLPIISGCNDYVLDNNPFSLIIPNDLSPVDIHSVINFYDSLYFSSKKNVIEKIRNLALSSADINQSYKKIVRYILEVNNAT